MHILPQTHFSFRLPHLHLCPFHFCPLASLHTASSLLLPPSESYCKYSTTLSGVLTVTPIFFNILGPQEVALICFGTIQLSQELAENTSPRCTIVCFVVYFWQPFLSRYPTTISHKLTNRAPTFGRLFPFNKMVL